MTQASKPLRHPSHNGCWIPVRDGVAGWPVEIVLWRKENGRIRYHAEHFGTECNSSESDYADTRWLEYVPPIVEATR